MIFVKKVNIKLAIIPVRIPTKKEPENLKKLCFFAQLIFVGLKNLDSKLFIESETLFHFSKASSEFFFASESLASFASE